MLRGLAAGPQSTDGILTDAQVADAALAGLEREAFLILPHPEVAGYMQNKAGNYDRWISGMAKLFRGTRERARGKV